MSIRTLIMATCVLASGTAMAQPGTEPPPIDPPAAPEPPTPPPPPAPPQPPRARVESSVEVQPMVEHPDRPTGFSLGVGIGYRFPTSWSTPNVSSVRLRLASGITFEPTVVFATSSHSVDTGAAMTQSATELGLGALARFPLVRHRRTDLELLAAVDIDSLSQDPDNDNSDDVRTVTTSTLRYGVAVGAWITPHLQASLSATNGLVSYIKTREEQGLGSVTITSDTTVGLIFDPTVVLMVHLYN